MPLQVLLSIEDHAELGTGTSKDRHNFNLEQKLSDNNIFGLGSQLSLVDSSSISTASARLWHIR
jgi:hypothetical protein